MADKVRFIQTTKDKFLSLSSTDDNALYFITDTQEIYKGKIPVGRAPGEILEIPRLIPGANQGEILVINLSDPQVYLIFKKNLLSKVPTEYDGPHIFYSDSIIQIYNSNISENRAVVVLPYATPICVDRSSYSIITILGNGGVLEDTSHDPEDYSDVTLELTASTWDEI